MSRSEAGTERIRAVFYYRVGSGVSRDHDTAIVRQAARIAEISERLNLMVIGIYTDFAVARSTPWPTRPAARRLTRRLAERPALADVVIVEDPQHHIGPDNIPAALKAIPIPLCTPCEMLRPVTADDPVGAITARMSTSPRPARRPRLYPTTDRHA